MWLRTLSVYGSGVVTEICSACRSWAEEGDCSHCWQLGAINPVSRGKLWSGLWSHTPCLRLFRVCSLWAGHEEWCFSLSLLRWCCLDWTWKVVLVPCADPCRRPVHPVLDSCNSACTFCLASFEPSAWRWLGSHSPSSTLVALYPVGAITDWCQSMIGSMCPWPPSSPNA
jgi:hypothetical protein